MSHKYVLITGGLGGVGLSTSHYLSERGFTVIVTDVHAHNDKPLPGNCIYIQMDISNSSSVETCFEKVRQLTDRLYAFINNAAIFDRFPLSEVQPEQLHKLLNTNVIGVINTTKTFIPMLLKEKGKVINISSEAAMFPLPLLAYGMSKAMMDVWHDFLKIELALLGIKVIRIRPGGHQTNFLEKTLFVTNQINENSRFRGLSNYMKSETQQRLKKISQPPQAISKIIYKAIMASNPKSEYKVNVSLLYRFLSLVPGSIINRLLIHKLKKINQ